MAEQLVEYEDPLVAPMNNCITVMSGKVMKQVTGGISMKLAQMSRVSIPCWRGFAGSLLIFTIALLLAAAVAVPQAIAAGGDLSRVASDSPQPGKQEAKASVVDSAGKLIVTGYQNLGAGTDDDYLTVKFNSDGTVAWRKTYDRAGGSDQATAIALDSSDNVIVTGYVWSGSNYDIYTVKYRGGDGAKLWEHIYNAPALGHDMATCIAVDNLDNVYVGGYVQTASAYEDYVILKYSINGPTTEGTPSWVATWNGAANGVDKLSSLTAGVGGVAVTGQSWNGTDFDVMTVKYDYSGTKLWEKRYSSPGQFADVGRKVAMDGSGNVIMTAAVTNNGNLDIYTAKYAAVGGALLWGTTYNNPTTDDEPFGLLLDSSGNAYVTGYTFTTSGNKDLLVVRYKGSDGTKEWERIYDSGTGAVDTGTELLLDSAGNLFVTGTSVTSGGNSNILTLKIKNDASNPALYWASIYDGTAGKNEKPVGIGLGTGGEVLVGGWSDIWTADASDYDYLMVAFDPGLLNPPSDLSATVLPDTSVKIDWTDNSANEDGFRIDRKLTELGTWSEVGSVGANVTTFTDATVAPSSTYYYRVRSFNAANGSSNPGSEIRVLTLYVTYKTPDWSYLYNSTDNLDDFPAGIAVGIDNNPVVTGYSLSPESGFDYFTVKLNNVGNGSLLWSDRYNDAFDQLDRATSVVVDSTNAAIVTGYSSLYYAPAGENVNSIYTTKYPASCSPPTPCTPAAVWHSQYNGPGGIDDRATAVATAVDGSDSVVVTGYGKNSAGNEDIYLIKYASAPAIDGFGKAIPEWSATPYNGAFNGDDFPGGVAYDKDGNVFVAGYVQSGSSPVRYQSFVAKYCGKAGAPCNGKTPGQIIWEDSFAGSGDNRARSLVVDKDGNLYVAGFDTGSNGRDMLLIKYDGKAVPTGSRVIWSKTVDGAVHGDDTAVSVKYDQVDDSVVVGGTVLTVAGDHDLIVIRYDSSGNEKWRNIHLRPGTDEEASDMAMDVSGNVSIVGYTSNGATSDAISVEFDYDGALQAVTIYNGVANGIDEATAVTFNSLGDTLVAGYSTNSSGDADYLVYKVTGLPLQASSPFTASQYYNKVDLTWADTSTGETGFYVERKTGACNSSNTWGLIQTVPANTTTYSDTGLGVGQEYCYRVRSYKAGAIDPRWIERYVRLNNPVPPGNVASTPFNTTRIDVTWQDNTIGETGFKIFRCAGAGCSDFTEIGSVLANVVSFSDTTVTAGISYSYKVLSYKTDDWESAFSAASTTTTTPSPATPFGLNAARASEGQINLSWSDTNNDETGFKIERCEVASCSFTQIGTVLANVTVYNDTIALKPDTLYRYRVRAYKIATPGWDGLFSATAEATTTLNATTGPAANSANTTTINLSWVDNTGAESGFKIERCLGGSCLDTDFTEAGQTVSSATTWSDTGVCNGSIYTYRVRAINSGLSMGGGGVWTRRKPLTIGDFQPNFQTKVTIAFDADMKVNFDDIRFYDETSKREIPYYLESKTDGSTATVWIKTAANNAISLYYGNANALSASNGAVVYEFFDDFAGSVVDTNKWTVTNGTGFSVSNGLLHGTNTSGRLTSKATFSSGVVLEIKAKTTTIAPGGQMIGGFYLSPSNSIGWLNYPVNAYYYYDGIWANKSDQTPAANLLYTLTAKNPTRVDLQIYNQDTSAMYWNLPDIYKSVVNEPIVLGTRYDNGNQGMVYATDWDWIRVRKYAATDPSASWGGKETSAGYAFDNTWVGLPSGTASATTPSPTAPTAPTAGRVSEARIDVTWTDTTSDETGFRIERCKGGSCTDFAEVGMVGGGISTFSDTTPMDVDSIYRYRVQAYKTATCNGGWNGPYSPIVSATTTLVAPSGLSATKLVSSTCDDLRFTDSDGLTLLNYWVESGCGTAATKVWLKMPTLPIGARQFYLNWANPPASAMSSATSVFDLYDDFAGTTIDAGKWVVADNGSYLSQNNEITATGGNGAWGSNSMYSTADFARPFTLELKHKRTAGNEIVFGAKDASSNATFNFYTYAAYPLYGTDLQVYESGSGRGSKATVASNVWEFYKFEVLSTGAKYYVGTSPAAYSLFYDSSFSSTSPLKIGFDNRNQAFSIDDVRVRKYAATPPTFAVGALETGTYNLTGGTWHARRPLTLTNNGSALTDYQQELTIDTTAVASDRITLNWTDTTATETGFIVERCTGQACNFSTIDSFSAAANATSFVDKSVELAKTYCYRVKAEKTTGTVWTSDPSNSACATTTTIVAPTLAVTTTTTNALSWNDATTGEDGFKIERCTGASCIFSPIDVGFPVVVDPNVTTYADTDVCSNTYRYRVKSFKVGPGGWDDIYSNIFETSTAAAMPPSGLVATRISELQLNLAWTDNTTDETGFKVERCEGSGCGNFSQIADVAANTTVYSDYGRAPNTTYRYRVRAYKGGGCAWNTAYSNESETTTSVAAPSALNAATPFSTLVNLGWIDNTASELAFKIERCETANCTYTSLATVSPNVTSYADASVCSGTGYTYRLNAVNEGSTNGGGGSWTRRKLITFTNFQPDFLVRVTVAYDPLMNLNFDDIRFVDTNDGSELPYWIESKTNGSSANVWIKTSKNSSGVYLYYGNGSATSSSSVIPIFGSGLMAYYPFNEADGTRTGTTAAAIGSGDNLPLNSFSAGYGVKTGGTYGNALSFKDGSTNYASLPTAPSLPTGSVATIEAWIYPTAYPDPTYNSIVSWGDGQSSRDIMGLTVQNSGRLSMYTHGNEFAPTSGATATLNAWNHVAAVLDGTSETLYTNGQLVGTKTFGSPVTLLSKNLLIGKRINYNGYYFNGMIDEVRIYSRALTAQEITGRYAATPPAATVGTTGEAINTPNTYSWSYASSYATAGATTPVLAAPTSFTATRVNESQINLAWTDAVTGETVFEIDRCIGPTCDFSVKTTIEVPADTISYKDFALSADTTYRYRIRSKRVATCTAYSSYAAAEAVTTLVAPGPLTVTASNTTQTNLSWTDYTEQDTGFKIERCTGSGCSTGFSQIGVTGASATTYVDTTACPGSAYGYRVAAFNAGLSLDGGGCWTRRKPITITNFQPDFQTKVTVAYDSDMKADFSDLRFLDPVTNQELPYWIENRVDRSTATVWVKTKVSSTIYLYYGNATASSVENAAATFEFFDGFSGTVIDTNIWTVTNGTGFSVSNGLLHGTNTSGRLTSKTTFSTGVVLEIKANTTSIASGGQMIGGFYLSPSNSIGWLNYPANAYYYYDGVWVNKADQTPAANLIYTLSTKNPTRVDLQIYNQDTSAVYWNIPDVYKSVVNEPIVLGTRYDDVNGYLDQAYATDWDWVRTRKYANPEPTTAVGTEEQSGCFTYPGTYTSGYSNIAYQSTPLPAAPTMLTATATTDTSINLTWSDLSNDETLFRIERCKDAGCSSFTEVTTEPSDKTSSNISTGHDPSTTYCFRVRADKAAACTTGWPTAYTNTSCDKLFPAQNATFTATALGPFKVGLSWNDSASDEDGYEIEVMAWNGRWVNIATTLPNVTTYLDRAGIEPLKTYTYRVRPFRGSDKSPYVTSNPVTTPAFSQETATCP